MQRIATLATLFTTAFALLVGTAALAQTPAADLRLGMGDKVRITVRDEPTLSGEFPVVEPGQVLLPEIGFVSLADRRFGEVASEISERYGRILVNAQVVSVPLLRIAVLGEVQRPGLFAVEPSQTLTDVLAAAGGFTPDANPRNIAVMREGGSIRISLSPSNPTAVTAPLRSGDQILVGRRSLFRENLPVLVGAGASVVVAVLTSLIVR